jgi:hypothetical protein
MPNRPHILILAVVVAALVPGAPAALAAPPATDELNPPPPSFLTCIPTGTGTICKGARHLVEEPVDTEIVCGSGAGAFHIYDQGEILQRAIRWYDADGNLTRRVIFERWKPAWWSNPLTGATVPYTQTNKFTVVLAVPGDLDSATTTIVGETIWTDPQTHQKVLRSVGRQVLAADEAVEFRSGQQPFLDAFVDGDMSVFDAVCAALAS